MGDILQLMQASATQKQETVFPISGRKILLNNALNEKKALSETVTADKSLQMLVTRLQLPLVLQLNEIQETGSHVKKSGRIATQDKSTKDLQYPCQTTTDQSFSIRAPLITCTRCCPYH